METETFTNLICFVEVTLGNTVGKEKRQKFNVKEKKKKRAGTANMLTVHYLEADALYFEKDR